MDHGRSIPGAAMRHLPGFTLIELALVLAIVAVLSAAATPSLQQMRGDWLLASSSQTLLTALHHTRSVAAARNKPVVLCQTDASGRCPPAAGQRATGWQVFVDHALSTPPRRDPGDELLASFELQPQVMLTGTRDAVTYWAGARAGTTATLTLCDALRRAPPLALIVSQTGRPRVSRVAADGSALACP
jgi:type IV fimbrial biogenesis protein FimT